MTNLIDRDALSELLKEPNAADAADVRHFALDLDSFDPSEKAEVAEWIRRQPVPVIGVGEDNRGLAECVDVQAENQDQLNQLVRAIEAQPKACAILVQVTRVTSELPTDSALIMESLGYGTLQGGEEFRDWLAGYREQNPAKSQAVVDDAVAVDRNESRLEIRLNSPANRNALSVSMRDGLTEAFKLVAMDRSIEEVHVWGEGPCFSAGGDLTEFGNMRDLAEAHRIRQARMPARYLAQQAHRYTFHLHGACVGAGIELPAFARHITATPDTWFQLPEIAMGLIPGAGGCVSMPGRIGRQRLNWLAITGDRLDAERALDWRLVDRIVEPWIAE